MWFKNALIFQYTLDDATNLSECLANERLKPCPPHARFIYGWLPTCGDELVHEVAGAAMICLGKEERILPRGVIQKILQERVQAWEVQQGRAMKRAEKAQMSEDLEFELLPKSFCVQKKMMALLDTTNNRIIINTSSPNQASQFTAILRKSVPGISIEPLEYDDNLPTRFTNWINHLSSLPAPFQLASDCALFSLDDEKKRFTCKGYELPAEEILDLLSKGLAPAEVSLVWNERIQFTLTHDFIIKKMKCLDYLADEMQETQQLEEDYEKQDAALTLLNGEHRALINDLLKELSPKKEHPLTTQIKEATSA